MGCGLTKSLIDCGIVLQVNLDCIECGLHCRTLQELAAHEQSAHPEESFKLEPMLKVSLESNVVMNKVFTPSSI